MSKLKLAIVPVEEFPKEVKQTPTEDLIEVYKVCLQIQDLCQTLKLGGMSAIQVGLPWALFVCRMPDWRYCLNYSFEPLSEETHTAVTRFINVERQESRYFLVKRYKEVKYRLQELVVKNQPELVERVGTDADLGLLVQNECGLLAGKFPHVDGEEYWFRK